MGRVSVQVGTGRKVVISINPFFHMTDVNIYFEMHSLFTTQVVQFASKAFTVSILKHINN